jgi:hypothetical protein
MPTRRDAIPLSDPEDGAARAPATPHAPAGAWDDGDAPREAPRDGVRDLVLAIGAPGAGKTVWIARALDALATEAVVTGGRIDSRAARSGPDSVAISAEPLSDATAARVRGIVSGLDERRWPAPTTEPVDHEVLFRLEDAGGVRERRLTIVDLPGAALLSAFAPSNPSTLTISWTVGNQLQRTAAVLAFVDPAALAARTQAAIDGLNAVISMLEHLRSQPHGRSVPVVIVLSRSDRGYKSILAEGGMRRFTDRHLGGLLAACESGRVYISSATRSRLVGHGVREPSNRRPPENLVEPMAFLLELILEVDALQRIADERARVAAERARDGAREERRSTEGTAARPISIWAWIVFAVGMLAAAVAATDVAIGVSRGLRDEGAAERSDGAAPPPAPAFGIPPGTVHGASGMTTDAPTRTDAGDDRGEPSQEARP